MQLPEGTNHLNDSSGHTGSTTSITNGLNHETVLQWSNNPLGSEHLVKAETHSSRLEQFQGSSLLKSERMRKRLLEEALTGQHSLEFYEMVLREFKEFGKVPPQTELLSNQNKEQEPDKDQSRQHASTGKKVRTTLLIKPK